MAGKPLSFSLTSAVGATFADAEATGTILNTPKGQRLPAYYGHDRPDWTSGQIFPTSAISTEDHTIDLAWAAPISYTALKYRINFAPVDPTVAESGFPWEGAETGNHWVHYPFATSTRLTGLTGGVEYKVRVQAQFPAIGQSPAWNGPWSHIMKVTVAGDAAPPPPLATASTVSTPTRYQYANGQLTSLKLTTSGRATSWWNGSHRPRPPATSVLFHLTTTASVGSRAMSHSPAIAIPPGTLMWPGSLTR